MEFKMFVKVMIVVIPLFSSLVLSEICPDYTKQFCACNGSRNIKIVPMRMCYFNHSCVTCPMELQDQIDCSVCPENECPFCSDNESQLQERWINDFAGVKNLFARTARKSRDAGEPLPHDAWCIFNRNMLNGQVECTYTTYSKECLLSCFDPYTVDGQKEYSFRCSRKENVWKPEIRSCQDTTGGFMNVPAIPDKSEEPQHSMPKTSGPKVMSGSNRYNDVHFDDEEGPALAGTSPGKDEYIYDSDGDADRIAQLGKGDAAASAVDSLADGLRGNIKEDALKDFYDILKSN